ncbi:hypothetical protein LDO32_05580 [Luteimonas sp. Y-2-2-4F]|nr:hypothetical protein [Luteimonas sp. Y-2-2-4F]MCD9031199.1 hypothetical protein [Luteimonas sp. Y-2-2-4F]
MEWMTRLWNTVDGFRYRPLRRITLPGTHDAGCYVDHVYGNVFSRTQTQDIAGQLDGGIRYFDLRPYQSGGPAAYSFWIYHGPFYTGGRLDGEGGILRQTADFIDQLGAEGRELVILNFSHFSRFSEADHQALIREIEDTLGERLIPRRQSGNGGIDLFEAPLVELLTDPDDGQAGPRVAILYDGALDTPVERYIQDHVDDLPAGFFVLSPKYAPGRNPIYLFDQYANRALVSRMQEDQLRKLRERELYPLPFAQDGRDWPANVPGGVASTLHLFSWTLTPQPLNPVFAARTLSNPQLPNVFSAAAGGWRGVGGHYDPAHDPQINILYVDDYASQPYDNPAGSPYDGVALPVAIAERLNVGAPWPPTW